MDEDMIYDAHLPDGPMNISEFIEILKKIMDNHGDIPIVYEFPDYGYYLASRVAIIENIKIEYSEIIIKKGIILS